MICAYCAKEYESGSVCPQCGGKMQAEANAIVCPYCDSVHTGGPRCANCGADLLSIFAPPPLPEPPVGKYDGNKNEYLLLDSNGITIHKSNRPVDVVIPYNKLRIVTWVEEGFFLSGFLSVRAEDDGRIPVTKSSGALNDTTTVTVLRQKKKDLRGVYEYLRLWELRNAQLRKLAEPQADEPPLPFGVWQGIYGCVELDAQTIQFRKKVLSTGKHLNATIRYDEIRDVVFHMTEDYILDYMSVRTWNDGKNQIASTGDAIHDPASITFDTGESYDLYKVYRYLAYWAEKNRENRK